MDLPFPQLFAALALLVADAAAITLALRRVGVASWRRIGAVIAASLVIGVFAVVFARSLILSSVALQAALREFLQ